ncbi:hypothetical protein [Actinomadura sp. 7K534]|uniref:hypothetical protein n=1 Tax=Actinomadura sp. 7K534 TaxID=2530366 RepID=UPI0010519226|nr:hypothetical protein [Actinomadura sp. 7K534]TDB96174.1 hypothetical protein E1266_10790 [Actinomadura sp. 7K534]
MSSQRLLRLGARTAEVEALYVRVLEAPDRRSEERRLAELAEAAARLAATARAAAGPRRAPHRRTANPRPAGRSRLERRMIRVRRTTDWIIERAAGDPR